MSKHPDRQHRQDARDARQDAAWWRKHADKQEAAGADPRNVQSSRDHAAKREADAQASESKIQGTP